MFSSGNRKHVEIQATILAKIFVESACENCFSYNFLHTSIKNPISPPTPFSMLTNHIILNLGKSTFEKQHCTGGNGGGGGIVYNNLVIHCFLVMSFTVHRIFATIVGAVLIDHLINYSSSSRNRTCCTLAMPVSTARTTDLPR